MRRASPVPVLGFIGLACLIVTSNACIFDQGNYKKGGRLDTGVSATENDAGKTSSSGSPLGDDDDTTPITDSGLVDTQ